MTDRLANQINGRLYAAELLLQEWEQHRTEAGMALAEALCDSVVFQLAVAYRLYLREIAAAYRYQGRCDSAAALRAGLVREGRDSAEVAVLRDAEQTGELAGLTPALQLANGEAGPSAGAVADVLVREGQGRPDSQQCRNWLRALRELIETQRGQLQEW